MVYSGMSNLGVVDKDSLPLQKLHKEVSNILSEQKEEAEKIIRERIDFLNVVVEFLINSERIEGDQLRKILEQH